MPFKLHITPKYLLTSLSKSSNPPMCRLLKNICGTVFLPDLAFASALRSGYLSKFMSMYSTPSFCILSLARMQNGQPVIEKIMTRPFMFDENRLILESQFRVVCCALNPLNSG